MSSQNIFELFQTDKELEKNGFALEYGSTTFILARAGGSNEKFQRCLDKKMRPYRSAVNSGTMQEETARKLMAEAYADTVILAWDNVTDINNTPIEFSKANVAQLLIDLPDLFTEIINESTRLVNYVAGEAEADSKS